MKYGDWFDAECEHVTALKKRACEKMQQWNHTYNIVEKYCVDRREEKRIQKKEEEDKKERERSRSQEYKWKQDFLQRIK